MPIHARVSVLRGPDAGATLVVRPGERAIVGRGRDATLALQDEDASRHHVALELGPDGLRVQDLGSHNGTTLGGQRLERGATRLARPVDTLGLGRHLLELRLEDDAAPAAASVREEYELLGELGAGAAARVLSARHRASGRLVALKVLRELLESGVGSKERLLREAEVCRRVDDPNVVRVHDVRVEAGQVFVVMELVDGPTAQQVLARGPLTIDQALHIALGVARGLKAVHAAGVVHRDVKPTNVLLTRTGEVKLADLGLCRVAGSGPSLTVTGTGLGTLSYVSPEQAVDAKRAGPAADLYSLGATLYHLLAGRPPFLGETADLLDKIADHEPPPLSGLRPDCPPALARLVHRLLEKDPDDRYPTAAVVADALARIRAGGA